MRTSWPWPEPPNEVAFYGLAGDIVRAIEPHSEADPVALLSTVIAMFGAAVGNGPHALVARTRHPADTFFMLIGPTGQGRKGESRAPIEWLIRHACPELRIRSGLSTGEGLVHAVRDAHERDAGEPDKRLFIAETEAARVLRVMRREGNTLPDVLREAWDHGNLHVLTRTSPATATGAHIVVLGHITVEELRRELDDVSMANGLINRFVLTLVRRSKELPDPEPFEGPAANALILRLAETLTAARKISTVRRDEEANALWRDVYHDLSAGRGGLSGAVCGRAEAHTLRLSLLYALLDQSPAIRRPHLEAALALWQYSERCAYWIFGDVTGDPDADTILRALQAAYPKALARTDFYGLFGNHARAGRIDQALGLLLQTNRIKSSQQSGSEGRGRRAEAWTAPPQQTNSFAIRTSQSKAPNSNGSLAKSEFDERKTLQVKESLSVATAKRERIRDGLTDDAYLQSLVEAGIPEDDVPVAS